MKGVLKVSKEQVIEIERYCDEHGITRKQRIDELGLSHTAYYYTRGLLSEEELHGGQFIPIMSGSGLMQAASMPVGKSRRKQAESRNGWDQSAASVKLKTLNDNPYDRELSLKEKKTQQVLPQLLRSFQTSEDPRVFLIWIFR